MPNNVTALWAAENSWQLLPASVCMCIVLPHAPYGNYSRERTAWPFVHVRSISPSLKRTTRTNRKWMGPPQLKIPLSTNWEALTDDSLHKGGEDPNFPSIEYGLNQRSILWVWHSFFFNSERETVMQELLLLVTSIRLTDTEEKKRGCLKRRLIWSLT